MGNTHDSRAPGPRAVAELLDMASDVVLVCGELEIPGCSFCCAHKSKLLHGILFDPDFPKFDTDARGRKSVSVPYRDPDTLKLCIDLMHDIATPSDVIKTLDDAQNTLQCMDYLDCDTRDVLEWAWDMVVYDESFETVFPNREDLDSTTLLVDKLFSSEPVRRTVVRDLFKHRPSWAFWKSRVLRALAHVDGGALLRSMAPWLMHTLARAFPPACLLFALLDATGFDDPEGPHFDAPAAFDLAGKHGSMYHPREASIVLERMSLSCRSVLPPHVVKFMFAVCDGLGTYTAAPRAAACFHGSVVEFHEPCTSVLAIIEGSHGIARTAKRLSSWLTMTVDPGLGRVDLKFTLGGIDAVSARAKSCELRIMAIGASTVDVIAERWVQWRDIDPSSSAWTSGGTVVPHGGTWNEDLVKNAFTIGTLKYVRVDFFYAQAPVFTDRVHGL
jgi:hypothetical protein